MGCWFGGVLVSCCNCLCRVVVAVCRVVGLGAQNWLVWDAKNSAIV